MDDHQRDKGTLLMGLRWFKSIMAYIMVYVYSCQCVFYMGLNVWFCCLVL